MADNTRPFTGFAGTYPTRAETEHALRDQGFGDDLDTQITVPMDGSVGPLANKLTECKSAHLMQHWPVMFNAVVKAMLKEANGS
jgi:hypothetical protein